MPLVIQRRQDPEACRELLDTLPDWFGAREFNDEYVEAAGHLPSYVALRAGAIRGMALVERHFPESAEIHFLGVYPDEPGSAVGTALVEALEDDLRADGVQYLQVKAEATPHLARDAAGTREFYLSAGFVPLQQLDYLGWNGPMLILVKKL